MSLDRGPTSERALTLGALGVVFGDIGTSPLYALRESFAGDVTLEIADTNVLGVLSLMLWSLIVVVTVKYLVIVLRADNHGEGGILALASLVVGEGSKKSRLLLLGLIGTALLYGDGMITPAISVLSAVEGIEVVAPSVSSWVVPIVAIILIGLFGIQRRGTETIGRLFGPIMLVWFSVISLLGVIQIVRAPSILRAVSPTYAIEFFVSNGARGYLVLGAVFLVVTGGEALYADLGHFGRGPIRRGWFVCVLPALLLNYFGQGALLLGDPTAIENPFFLLAPRWAQWPLTVLATMATVIASQALISGAFSLTAQAINLEYLPRMRVLQTSEHHRGQVYVPAINWFLLIACLGLVFSFGSSAKLAAAYGVAVTLTMVITTILVGVLAHQSWGWSATKVLAVLVPLGVVDLAFTGANIFKIPAGGWFPLLVGAVGVTGFTTWRTGRHLVGLQMAKGARTTSQLVEEFTKHPPPRHPGTGVYLHRTAGRVPPILSTNLRLNGSLHENLVFLSISTDDRPFVPLSERATRHSHPFGINEVELRYGFVEQPHVVDDLLSVEGLDLDPKTTTYLLGRERVEIALRPGMATWRDRLFALMVRNASDPSAHFGLPADRSVDIGTHVAI